MGKYIINGGMPLRGEVWISGAKNSALPLLSACLLTKDEMTIHNCPRIDDVFSMLGILESLGARVRFHGNTINICAEQISTTTMPEMLSKKIRSSIFLLGSMLGRKKEAAFSYPGGCEIGKRPIDQHLNALRLLGVEIAEENEHIMCKTKKLAGNTITLSYPSVGATENAILAAVLAVGVTVIETPAREPEIEDLQNMLIAMGARITGAGTSRILIEGVKELHGTEFTCIPDRIEVGTFLAAAAVTRGNLVIQNVIQNHLRCVLDVFHSIGARIKEYNDAVAITVNCRLKPFQITTLPYPDFPTDMQAQMCSVAALCDGVSRITETVFENRLRHVQELIKGGATASISGHSAYINGVFSLNPCDYVATDLRGGTALVLAALSTRGKSTVDKIEFIDRGYQAFERKLTEIGADIRRE